MPIWVVGGYAHVGCWRLCPYGLSEVMPVWVRPQLVPSLTQPFPYALTFLFQYFVTQVSQTSILGPWAGRTPHWNHTYD